MKKHGFYTGALVFMTCCLLFDRGFAAIDVK